MSKLFIKDLKAMHKYSSGYTRSTLVQDNLTAVRNSADWLLKAQKNSGDGDGYSRCFSLFSGWDRGYPETTGYIIPTMLEVRKYLGDSVYRGSAQKAGEWLLFRQHPKGFFCDMDTGKPLAFDTGQALIGLMSLFKETKNKVYEEAVYRGARWLTDVMDEDGSWSTYGYLSKPHTYYSRVAAAVYAVGEMLDIEDFRLKARKNIYWVISQQFDNGFFGKSGFVEGDFLLHTMMYVLEGLIEYYKVTCDEKVWESIKKNADMWKIVNRKKDIILRSYYNAEFNAVAKDKCVTGLAQWAGVCLDLYKITEDEEFFRCAVKTIYYLKNKQIKEGDNVYGAFSGAVPYWSKYGRFKVLNWNNKFFLDAVLKYQPFELQVYKEQELWVSECFEFNKDVVLEDISPIDREYIRVMDSYLQAYNREGVRLLDLGCGKGKFLKCIRDKYTKIESVGVDSSLAADECDIVQGSAYSIPLEDNSVDVVLVVEVLQHIEYLERTFSEIKRVLKNDGLCIIGERNPRSLLGFMKPALQAAGMWMYPCDSPFKERWYSKSSWKAILKENGLAVKAFHKIDIAAKVFKKKERFFVLVAQNG